MNFSLARIVSVEEFRDLLLRSTLSARRPVEDLDCLRGMLDNSDIVATCWNENLLVGIARSITDFSYSCYLSDLAVDVNFQKQGIGPNLYL
jgi:ribosomal protein S18 acetylase RimI-like enzyme